MTTFVVIPAYDAERHLDGVVRRVLALHMVEPLRLVIVDDGSQDDTPRLAATWQQRDDRIFVLTHKKNGGYGAAMKSGLTYAIQHGATLVACVHADGQYSPEALPGLVQRLRQEQLDLLQGSRIRGGGALQGGMPLYKYAANAALNVLENRCFGLDMTDYHSGYLVYGQRALASIPFSRLSSSFDFDLEVIACARARGLRVTEAPIPTHYGDEVSHLRPIPYGMRVLGVLWNYRRGYYDPS